MEAVKDMAWWVAKHELSKALYGAVTTGLFMKVPDEVLEVVPYAPETKQLVLQVSSIGSLAGKILTIHLFNKAFNKDAGTWLWSTGALVASAAVPLAMTMASKAIGMNAGLTLTGMITSYLAPLPKRHWLEEVIPGGGAEKNKVGRAFVAALVGVPNKTAYALSTFFALSAMVLPFGRMKEWWDSKSARQVDASGEEMPVPVPEVPDDDAPAVPVVVATEKPLYPVSWGYDREKRVAKATELIGLLVDLSRAPKTKVFSEKNTEFRKEIDINDGPMMDASLTAAYVAVIHSVAKKTPRNKKLNVRIADNRDKQRYEDFGLKEINNLKIIGNGALLAPLGESMDTHSGVDEKITEAFKDDEDLIKEYKAIVARIAE